MKYAATVLLLLSLFACRRHAEPRKEVRPAFYCWETDPNYGWTEYLDSLDTRRMYLRLFDVAWDAAQRKPFPAGPYRASWLWGDSIEPVPVIFITNETLQQLDSAGVARLAQQIQNKSDAMLYRLATMEGDDSWDYYSELEADTMTDPAQKAVTRSMASAEKWMARIREWQIDCDWTAGTRLKFFYLLEELKRLEPGRALSCTIRLHQFKYPDKTGVPPVARGMLMCYNLDDLKNPETPNSIFSYEQARKYLENTAPYPLPLDVALPTFRWGVLFHAGKFKCIVPAQTLKHEYEDYFEQVNEHLYRAKSDFTLNDQYVRQGDVVRFESPDQEDLLRTIRLLRRLPLAEPLNLAFFDLGSSYNSDADDKNNIPDLPALVAAFR